MIEMVVPMSAFARGADAHLFAVLRHGAAGQGRALHRQEASQVLVAEAVARLLILDQFADDILNAQGAIEKVGEWDQAAIGQQRVFVRGGAADRAFIQTQPRGDLGAGQRAQVANAFLQELALIIYHQLGDPFQRAPAAMNAINEKSGAVAMLMDITLHLMPAKLRLLLFRWDGIAYFDLEMIAFLLDQLYLKARVPFADDDIGSNISDAIADRGIVCIVSVGMGWERMELAADIGAGLAYLLLRDLELASYLMELVASQQIKVAINKDVGEGRRRLQLAQRS